MKWYRAIWLSCDKATFLTSKKEEGRLLFVEKIQLFLHMRICVYCKRFQTQVRIITGKASLIHEHREDHLKEGKKLLIKSMLKD